MRCPMLTENPLPRGRAPNEIQAQPAYKALAALLVIRYEARTESGLYHPKSGLGGGDDRNSCTNLAKICLRESLARI